MSISKSVKRTSVFQLPRYIRYNFFSVPPIMKDYDDLTKQLKQVLLNDRKREHYKKHELIEQLWEEEQQKLLHLPEMDYPVFKEKAISVNKYNEFKLDQHLIHVPKAKNCHPLYCILYWDKYKVVTEKLY